MKPKKNPKIEVGRNSSLYFAVGLLVMLVFTNMLLEHKTYDKADNSVDLLIVDKEFDEDIPITTLNVPPPPPPPPPPATKAPETIKVVDDAMEVEESVLESTETNQEEGIEDRIIEVNEVEVEEVEEDIEVPFSVVEKVPVFPGCIGSNASLKACFQEKIAQHIAKNFKYPEKSIESQQQGKVYVMFYVDKNGNISNMRTRGPYKTLEKEAERIIRLLPKMEPAKQRNKPVKVPYSVPIVFKIQS